MVIHTGHRPYFTQVPADDGPDFIFAHAGPDCARAGILPPKSFHRLMKEDFLPRGPDTPGSLCGIWKPRQYRYGQRSGKIKKRFKVAEIIPRVINDKSQGSAGYNRRPFNNTAG
jgi:hypothetical protein